MITHRFTTSSALRLCFAAALFWVVGCKSGGAPAVASPSAPTTEKAPPTVVKAAPAPAVADKQAAPAPAAAPVEAAPATKSATAAPTSTKPKAADKKPTFKITSTAPALAVGKKGAASVSIAALNGYKWNKEYPAKLIFKDAPKNIKLGKNEFKQMSGDFKIGDKKTNIPVGMQATTAGKETVKGVLKFSVCNETACIIEKADVALAVSVQP
ncbi:MAG: hypothetical protein ACPGU1_05045 [Myxococcota bacterium]